MNKPRRDTIATRPARLSALIGLSLAALALPAQAQNANANPNAVKTPTASAEEGQWVPGRLLVQPRPGLPEAEFEKALKPHGGKQVGRIDGIDVRIIQLPPQASEKAVEALLKHNKHLQFVERDMILKPEAVVDDPYFGSAWHLPKIGATTAWERSQGEGITIAILDSGVDAAHPDLASKLVPGWNFYNYNADTSDVYGHGTQVAGAAAAASNNGVGVASVAGAARIMPIRVTDTSGMGYISTMASGITWAADQGARVANLSFAAAGAYSTVQSAAQYMKNKGGLVVTAAGNDGKEQPYTANASTIVVSATGSSDVKASWSTYGQFVDIAAPGVSIYTTKRGGGYGAASGTSFASPVTAGVAALMMAANPTLGAADIEKALFASATDIGTAGFDNYYGHGRVNAGAAVAAVATVKTSDTSAPTVSITSPSGGSQVQGLVAVDVAASDNVGVSRVDLLVNGAQVASDTTAPYGFSWDSTQVADGAATLTANAYDAAGNHKATAVSVTVANVIATPEPEPTPEAEPTPEPGTDEQTSADTAAPVATIGNPVDGSKVNGNVTVQGSAADDVGVARMRLFINGELVSTANGSNLSYRWNTRKIDAGSHTVVLEAEDAAGNKGSRSVSVTK